MAHIVVLRVFAVRKPEDMSMLFRVNPSTTYTQS